MRRKYVRVQKREFEKSFPNRIPRKLCTNITGTKMKANIKKRGTKPRFNTYRVVRLKYYRLAVAQLIKPALAGGYQPNDFSLPASERTRHKVGVRREVCNPFLGDPVPFYLCVGFIMTVLNAQGRNLFSCYYDTT